MSKRTREVWHCDVCGWEWLPDTNKVPERCPNRECRKRNWNQIIGKPNEALYSGNEGWLAKTLRSAEIGHDPTCKCLICKPPKPQ